MRRPKRNWSILTRLAKGGEIVVDARLGEEDRVKRMLAELEAIALEHPDFDPRPRQLAREVRDRAGRCPGLRGCLAVAARVLLMGRLDHLELSHHGVVLVVEHVAMHHVQPGVVGELRHDLDRLEGPNPEALLQTGLLLKRLLRFGYNR